MAPAAAFTLIEVIAAITILALVTGSVYALLRQSLQAAAELQDAEREDQALRRFVELCRATFETLPPGASLSLASAEETGVAQELTLSGVPEAFCAGPEPAVASDLVFGLQLAAPTEDAAGSSPLHAVAISREEFAPKVQDGDFRVRAGVDDEFYQPDDQGRYWLPLLSGIRSLEWRYWNETDRLWEDDWSKAPERPPLLELQLWPENRPAPLRAVFRLPELPSGTAAADTGSAEPGGSGGEDPNAPANRGPRERDGGENARGPGDPGRRSPGERGREGRGGRDGRGSGGDQGRDGAEMGPRAPRGERGGGPPPRSGSQPPPPGLSRPPNPAPAPAAGPVPK